MVGLPHKLADFIENFVDNKFNSISLDFLGLIPKLSREKKIVFTTNKSSLTSLFLQALGSRNPNQSEEDTLKTILRISSGYVDMLKEKTKTNILQNVDSYFRNQNLSDNEINTNVVQNMINDEIDKAGSHFKMIVNAESQKAINTGTALQIKKVGESQGIADPTVFFIVTVDDVTGPYEFILHLLPDRVTPRVWKLSEIQSGYYKPGDQYPSFSGLHPNCRCKITYLAPNWGFDGSGHIKFKGLDWDEFKEQRAIYALPNVPAKISRSKKFKKSEDLLKSHYDHRRGQILADYNDLPGAEHPLNHKRPLYRHEIAHKAQDGNMYWVPKDIKPLDNAFTNEANKYMSNQIKLQKERIEQQKIDNKLFKNNGLPGVALSSVQKLIAHVTKDPDRYVRKTNLVDNNQHGIRLRHLHHILNGAKGYSMEPMYKENLPKNNENFIGMKITAERHPVSGNPHRTIWHWDGNNLKTIFHGIVK